MQVHSRRCSGAINLLITKYLLSKQGNHCSVYKTNLFHDILSQDTGHTGRVVYDVLQTATEKIILIV